MVYTPRARHRFYKLYFEDIKFAEQNEYESFTFQTIQKKGKQEEYHAILELILDHHEIFFDEIKSEILFEGSDRSVYCNTTIYFF